MINEILTNQEQKIEELKGDLKRFMQINEELQAKLNKAIDALELIGRGESQFDNVNHMYTARETLKEINKR